MAICSKLITSKFPRSLGLIAIIATIVLSACSSNQAPTGSQPSLLTRVFKPYRADIVQGNFVSKEQMDMIKVGMGKDQIKQILGTPLLNDIFHADRWDYVFAYKRGDTQQVDERKIALFFKGSVLARIEGDEAVQTEKELVAEIDQIRKGEKKQKMPATRDEGSNVRMAPTVTNPTGGIGVPAGGR